MVTTGIPHLAAAGAGLVLLGLAWWMLSSYLKPRAASLDLQDLNVLQPNRNAARMYVANSLALLLAMILVATSLWGYLWQLAVIINVAIIFSVMAYMKYIHIALKVKPPPIKMERILHNGAAPATAVGPYFGPHKARARVARPMRSLPVRHGYRPVPKDALIPEMRVRRGDDGGD